MPRGLKKHRPSSKVCTRKKIIERVALGMSPCSNHDARTNSDGAKQNRRSQGRGDPHTASKMRIGRKFAKDRAKKVG